MKTNLTAPFGRIEMDTIKRNDLSAKQKLIYSVIAVKQGESDFAKLSNVMIADAVDCTPRYVSESISKMEKLKLLVRISKGKIHAVVGNSQFGNVELDMLITTNISARAKYLYLIYCLASNDYDANYWGRDSICSGYHISNSTYYLAHKELLDKTILETIAQSSGNGIQTSNINLIIRTEKWQIERPLSWIPQEPFDLDKWCLINIDEEGRVQPEVANSDFIKGTEDTTQEDEGVQRTLTINSNLNSSPISNLEQTNGSFSTPAIVPPEEELNIALATEVIKRKLKTPEEAKEAINTLNENGFEGIAKVGLTDEIIERAFIAFKYFKEAVENYGQDTSGYALNIDDMNKFALSGLSVYDEGDEMSFHISRVVELGYEKLNKPYISFSYVINTDNGIHQQFR